MTSNSPNIETTAIRYWAIQCDSLGMACSSAGFQELGECIVHRTIAAVALGDTLFVRVTLVHETQ
jgi:hypothetical protein